MGRNSKFLVSVSRNSLGEGSSLSSSTSVSSSSSVNGGPTNDNAVTTPCTPGDPLTHYHHKNNDHYVGAFGMMNRMRINSQVSYCLETNIHTLLFHLLKATDLRFFLRPLKKGCLSHKGTRRKPKEGFFYKSYKLDLYDSQSVEWEPFSLD